MTFCSANNQVPKQELFYYSLVISKFYKKKTHTSLHFHRGKVDFTWSLSQVFAFDIFVQMWSM